MRAKEEWWWTLALLLALKAMSSPRSFGMRGLSLLAVAPLSLTRTRAGLVDGGVGLSVKLSSRWLALSWMLTRALGGLATLTRGLDVLTRGLMSCSTVGKFSGLSAGKFASAEDTTFSLVRPEGGLAIRLVCQ